MQSLYIFLKSMEGQRSDYASLTKHFYSWPRHNGEQIICSNLLDENDNKRL